MSRARTGEPSSRRQGWWARFTESVESRLWPAPVAMIVVAVALGFILPGIDRRFADLFPTAVDSVLFSGGSDTARSVLSAIAGSLITATSLTFSLTVVTLQLASSQASPRVLRLFARDRHVHWTLATFLGTFAYAITVLRSVRSGGDDIQEFVPRLAVTLAFLLTLVSVVMLVLFLAHLAAQLRVETMLKEIHEDTDEVIDRLSSRHEGAEAFEGAISRPPERRVVVSPTSGFITARDHFALVRVAAEHSVVVEEIRRVGQHVVAGTPLAYWWSRDQAVEPDVDAIDQEIQSVHAFDYERTAAEDIDFGVQQILDIALRALSPGVNDPTTAVNALGHLSAITGRMATMARLPVGLTDDSGLLRVITVQVSAADQIEAALAPVRHYAADSPSVVARWVQAVDELAYLCGDSHARRALVEQLDALEQQLRALDSDPVATDSSLRLVEASRARLQQDGHTCR